jgi:hypothetical protein
MVCFKHGYARKGERRTPEYSAYDHARSRCTNPNVEGYANYGGRGIEFKFRSFQEFIGHIGPKPSPKLTLDRINNDGHYEIGNVKWSTRREQFLNSRPNRGWRKKRVLSNG